MARHLFGQSPADVAMEKVGNTLELRPGAEGIVYDVPGGTALTDLLDSTATPVSSVIADADGRVGFYGPDGDPDGPTHVWVDFGYGAWSFTATDIGDAVAGKVDRNGDDFTGPVTMPALGVTGAANVTGRLDVGGGIYSAGTLLTPGGGGGGGGTAFSLGGPTHIVYQSGGRTIAKRVDGTSLSDLPTTAANNLTVIQAAINDANTGIGVPAFNHYPGGHVYIDRGVYDIPASSSIVAKYGVALSGSFGSYYDNWNNAGTFGTMIRANGAGTAPLIVAGVLASGSRVATNPHGLWIQSLILQGNARAGEGIQVNDTAFTRFRDLYIRDTLIGMNFRGAIDGVFSGTMDPGIQGCIFKNNAMCIDQNVVAPGTFTGTDAIVSDCRFMSSTGTQVRIKYGGWQVANCHFTHGTGVLHLDVDGADVVQINNNYFDSGNTTLVNLKCSSASSFIGNLLIIENNIAHASGAAVELPWGRVTAIGNFLRPSSTYNNLKGFIATGTPSQGVIFGNITLRRTGKTGWVNDVVSLTGVSVANRDDGGSYIGGNKNWVV
jgi:hypothetical protein